MIIKLQGVADNNGLNPICIYVPYQEMEGQLEGQWKG
jgi:hypothetical protein